MTRRKEFTIVEEGELTEVAKALIEFAGEDDVHQVHLFRVRRK
jgi:hypothetical protein